MTPFPPMEWTSYFDAPLAEGLSSRATSIVCCTRYCDSRARRPLLIHYLSRPIFARGDVIAHRRCSVQLIFSPPLKWSHPTTVAMHSVSSSIMRGKGKERWQDENYCLLRLWAVQPANHTPPNRHTTPEFWDAMISTGNF